MPQQNETWREGEIDLQQLILRINGDATGATNALNSVGAATNKFGDIVKSIIAGAAVAAMVKWTETTVNLGIKMDEAGTLMGATMQHILGSTNEQIDACKAWAENQEKVNHFDATDLMAQMDKAIVKYGDLGTAQLAVNAAEEVSRLKGVDLSSAYSMVEQASNGMARSLKEFGITAVAGTSQLTYLKEITDKVSGSTDAYNKTTAGMKANLATTYEMMREQLGQALLPTINALATGMVPVVQKIADFVTAHKDDIAAMVQKVSDKISDLCDWLATVNLESVFSWIGKIAGAAGILLVVGSIATLIAKIEGIGIALTTLSANPAFWVLAPIALAAGYLTKSIATYKDIKAHEAPDTGETMGDIAGATPNVGLYQNGYQVPGSPTTTKPKTTPHPTVPPVDKPPPITQAEIDAAKAAAQKIADAAKAAAEAIKQARQGITDKIFALTHTEQETEQRALDQELAANIASSKDKVASRTLYTAESKALVQKYADAAKAIYQTVTDKIYTLTHTDVQNQQRALDQEYAANLKNGVDKLTARTLYADECKALEEEQTKKEQEELDKRLAAQQRYNDAVANATKSLTDQIYAWTHTAQQKEASDIAMQAATAFASGVAPATINKYVSAATSNMYSEAGPAGTSSGAIAAVGQYLAGPLKKLNDGIDTLIGVTSGVASGVGQAINGMGGGRIARTI